MGASAKSKDEKRNASRVFIPNLQFFSADSLRGGSVSAHCCATMATRQHTDMLPLRLGSLLRAARISSLLRSFCAPLQTRRRAANLAAPASLPLAGQVKIQIAPSSRVR